VAGLVGVSPVVSGYPDGGLCRVLVLALTGRVQRAIREYAPDLLLVIGPAVGGPDDAQVAQVGMPGRRASAACRFWRAPCPAPAAAGWPGWAPPATSQPVPKASLPARIGVQPRIGRHTMTSRLVLPAAMRTSGRGGGCRAGGAAVVTG
jgi:hypothetical protein